MIAIYNKMGVHKFCACYGFCIIIQNIAAGIR